MSYTEEVKEKDVITTFEQPHNQLQEANIYLKISHEARCLKVYNY